MDFLFIKGDNPQDVRMSKYIACLSEMKHNVSFWGWDRKNNSPKDVRLCKCRYLYRGGGFGGNVAFRYPIWMVKLFFAMLFSSELNRNEIVAVNFDAALPVYIACILRRKKYVYEILDEFALSYKFPKIIKKMLSWIDHCIMRNAKLVIHVDENRVTYEHCNHIVIENAPEDYWHGKDRDYKTLQNTFAVVGCLAEGRGITSICDFVANNEQVHLLVVGTFWDAQTEARVKAMPRVKCLAKMPQQDLFKVMEECCAIFSLYDPSLEINRLAASNKVYDAMMMGIPVITNKEVINSEYIKENGVGIVVDYVYNNSWDVLAERDFKEKAVVIGKAGRKLYLEKYQFHAMLEQRFLPALHDVQTK